MDYLNPACFWTQAPGTFGNLGRDVLRAPGAINFDFALTRTFRISGAVATDSACRGLQRHQSR